MNRMFFVAFLLLLLPAIVAAALPQTLNVQGRLTNSSTGTSLVGSFSINFTLYDAASAGNSVYTQTQSVTTDANGLYSVVLTGVTAPFDAQYYLGVKVGSDSEMTPRLNLTASPYAFQAANVTCTNCLTGTQIDESTLSESDPQVGTATNTYLCYGTATNIVECNDAGATYAIGTHVLSLTGGLTVGGTSNSSFDSDTLFIDASNDRVGIGDNAPFEMLTVHGGIGFSTRTAPVIYAATDTGGKPDNLTIRAADTSAAMTNAGNLYLEGGSASDGAAGSVYVNYNQGNKIILGKGGITSTGVNMLPTGSWALEVNGTTKLDGLLSVTGNVSVDTSTLYVDSTNNRVGIGKAVPTTNLDIYGSGVTSEIKLGANGGYALLSTYMGGSAFAEYLYLSANNYSTTPTMTLRGYGEVGINTSQPNATLQIVSGNPLGALKVQNASNTFFFVNGSNGVVSIGRTNSAPLTNSVLTVNGSLTVSGTDGVIIDRYSSTTGSYIYLRTANGTESNPAVVNVNQELGKIIFSGYNGSSFEQTASIAAIANGTFGAAAPTDLIFATTNITSAVATERMRIKYDGNVGIGTTSPARTLHINDTLRLQPRSAAPSSAAAGDIYYDGDSNVGCLYNGTAWNSFGGSGTCA